MPERPESGDFQHIGELLGLPKAQQEQPEARVAYMWPRAVGREIARNSQPRSLWKGRLVVAASSAVWAQTLQFMADDIARRLNDLLGEELVREVRARPAGWDPGAAAGGPGGSPAGPPYDLEEAADFDSRFQGAGEAGSIADAPLHPLSAEEERELEQVRESAPDPVLGEQIAAAMRACLQRRRREEEG